MYSDCIKIVYFSSCWYRIAIIRVYEEACLCTLRAAAAVATSRQRTILTLIVLTCRIWCAPNNARKWQTGFNLAFKA